MRHYPKEALEALANSRETADVYGTKVLLKKTDQFRAGCVDAYEKAYRNPDPGETPAAAPASPMEIAGLFRNIFGCHNYDLNEREIYTRYEVLKAEGREVGLWRYYLRRRKATPRPCLFYIHGGGWVAGSVYAVEKPCKLVAELADAVVFNIDYTLAPEGPYPAAFNELWAALKHIYEHADQYGIDPGKIMVAGDSAGGNLAAALALRDRDEGTHMIAKQFLLYPAVVLGKQAAEGYEWKVQDYEIGEEDKGRIRASLGLDRPESDKENQEDPMTSFYLQDPSLANTPYVSPMLAKRFDGTVPAVIATAEYDSLRIQGEFYGGQLQEAGVPVKVMRYMGSFHAYLDRLGYVPQSEDVCREMAQELNRL